MDEGVDAGGGVWRRLGARNGPAGGRADLDHGVLEEDRDERGPDLHHEPRQQACLSRKLAGFDRLGRGELVQIKGRRGA